MAIIRFLFQIDKKPKKGLLAVEWVILAYLTLTLLMVLFTYTKIANPETMIWGRVRIVIMTVALWAVYRMLPCRFTLLCRISLQLILLSWWYPDTYGLNSLFPSQDHLFAHYEQTLFGCQPALLFCQHVTNAVWSELMYMSYGSYYPTIAIIVLFYFICKYEQFLKVSFVILAAFFLYYVIFIFLPVTGPQYYYLAVGTENITQGIFPDIHNYFATHQESLPNPGWSDGIFYQLVQEAHNTGERPTAAFPSSHVGIGTIVMFLAWKAHNKRLFYLLLPLYVLMCLSTVYIQAHYLIDVIGGWVSAVIIYWVLDFVYDHIIREREK